MTRLLRNSHIFTTATRLLHAHDGILRQAASSVRSIDKFSYTDFNALLELEGDAPTSRTEYADRAIRQLLVYGVAAQFEPLRLGFEQV